MLGLIGRYDGLLWGLVAILCAIIASRILKWTVVRLEGRHPDEERELTRLRRGETAVALIATAIPYVAAIIVIIAIASIFLPRTAAASERARGARSETTSPRRACTRSGRRVATRSPVAP